MKVRKFVESTPVDREGCKNYYGFYEGNRYFFDYHVCLRSEGWRQYDTYQDAWYFGMWIHPEERLIFTYAEGDTILQEFATKEDFLREMSRLNEVHGTTPVIATAYCFDGTVVKFKGNREVV
ncbi:MAG: hypothetical protein HQM11_07870 [SAR324 cluster bacterium]|nr:hypothetical protein [SAR324 cluster bacterium]